MKKGKPITGRRKYRKLIERKKKRSARQKNERK
jgi:hypothetical protein